MLFGVFLINNPARFEKFIPKIFSSKRTLIYVMGISGILFGFFLLIPTYSSVGKWGLICWICLLLLLVIRYLLSNKNT